MTLKTLARLGVSNVEIARTLGVTEGTVRYHRRRLAAGATERTFGHAPYRPRTWPHARRVVIGN